MTFKKICAMAAAAAIAFTGISIIPARAAEEMSAASVEKLYQFSGDAHGLSEQVNGKAQDGTKGELKMVEENARMFDKTLQCTIAKGAWDKVNYGQMYYYANITPSIDVQGYKYVNAWIYSGNLPKDASGNTSTLTLRVQNNIGYAIPIDWDNGWKLVSIPVSSFNDGSGAKFPAEVNKLELTVNYTAVNGKRWANGGEVLIDYIYLSEEAPPQEQVLTVTESNIADEANTVSLTMGHSLNVDSIHADKVTVTKNGETLSGGYTVDVDSTKLNIVFENSFEPSATYSISADPGCVYDEYGYTLADVYTTEFAGDGHVLFFKVTGTQPGNGAENVPIDLGGDRSYSIGFSNPPAEDALEQGVTLYQNGAPMYGGYSVELQEARLILRMNQDLQSGAEYAIELAENLQDIYGHTIIGDLRFTFTTAPADTGTYVIADFSDDDDFKNLGIAVSGSADADGKKPTASVVSRPEARRSGQVLEYNIPKGSWTSDHGSYGTALLSGRVSADGSIDFANAYKDYKYYNMWVYSDALPMNADGNAATLNLFLSPSSNALANNSFCYILPVNWNTGWKLVSIALSDFIENVSGSGWDVPVLTFGIAANYTSHGGVRWADGGTVLIDRIYLSKEQPGDFTYTGATLPSGYSGVPVKDAELELVYTNAIGTVDSNAVTVEKNGAAINGFETAVNENRLTVRFTEDLDCNTRYIVKVSTDIFDSNGQQAAEAAELEFITAAAGISVGRSVMKTVSGVEYTGLPAAGAQVVVEASAANGGTQSQTAALCVAQYDKNGTMLSLTEESSSLAAGSSEVLKATITRMAETAVIRAFVCDESGKLLRTDYSVLGADDAQDRRIYGAAAAVTDNLLLDSAETHVDELNISGSYGGIGAVLLGITNEKGEQILTVPVYADAKGRFTYQYTFGGKSSSGNYTVSASANGKVQTLKTEYLATKDQDDLLDMANGSQTSEISAFLKANQGALGLSGLSAAKIEGIAQTIFEQKPYGSYGDVLSVMEQSKSILSALNSTRWSGMTAFLAKNRDIVLYDNGDYAYYAGLSDENRNLINQAVVKGLPTDSFVKFRELFSKATADYKAGKLDKKPDKGSGNSGGGGGSGGSGGVTSVGFSADIVSDYTNRTGIAESSENTNAVFVDLGTSAWAEESIAQLYELGVISPSEDKKFRPEDSVTRAEFVKLLVAALGIELKEESCGFTDAVDGEWYQPYLAAARAAGMIEGNPDGSFGIENPITRQDMATMAYRAVTILNKTLRADAESESFSDAADIAEYAQTAVDAIQRAGVINGMGDGSFCPLEQASRAQAAKVISGLLNAVG